jgi:mono/diheme cytochrome c family protein
LKYIMTAIIVLIGLGVAIFLYAWSGIYNIAATEPHWGITSSFIRMLRNRSIAEHSDDIQVPNMNDEKLKEAGLPNYHETCRLCHGAPAQPPAELAEGLYPPPPSMTSGDIQEALNDVVIYWIVKHGIKLTGMPAFGPTHDENELWGLVTIAKEIPRISPEQYRQLVKSTNSGGEREHGHSYGKPVAE